MEKLITISSKQLKQIENKNPNIDIYIRIALYTGLRYSSIANITYKDIVREGNHYFILIKKMKKQTSIQKVRISKDIYTKIQNHKKKCKYENFIIEGIYSNKPLSIQYINKILKYFLECSSHKLRHTFALVNKLNGAEIDIICNCLFHKNIVTTMIYIQMALTIKRLYEKKYINEYINHMKKYVCIIEN